MAEIFFLEKNYELSWEYAQKALDYNAYNLNALLLQASINRHIDRPYGAQEILRKILEDDPLNHLARFERYLSSPTEQNLESFRRMIRNELPNETYMELALHYVNLGMIDPAIQLFQFIPDYPASCYWLAYLHEEKEPEKSQAYLERSRDLSPFLVFPYREESIPVFEWASQKLAQDWKPKYYLALILWNKGRVQEAQDKFDSCGNHPDFAPFYLARGHIYKNIDLNRTEIDFKHAVQLDPETWKTWHTLIDFYLTQNKPELALEASLDAIRLFPQDDFLRVDLARALVENEQSAEAADILDKLEILPSEGATGVHQLFVRCHVNIGLENIQEGNFEQAIQHLEKAKTFPENLGSGQPYESDQRMQDYLLAYAHGRIGNPEKSEEIKKAIYDYTMEHLDARGANQYFGGLALIDLGERSQGRELLRKNRLPEDFLQKIRSVIR
jgi:tetratricopeptide (TPR) repeat protein